MWDLDQIIRNNDQAALEWMMSGKRSNQAQDSAPEGWPLTLIGEHMTGGPPHLASLVDTFNSEGVINQFNVLIRKFLPEYEGEITAVPLTQRVYRFCYRFSRKYFPIPMGYYRQMIGDFITSMPVEILGLSYHTYHDLGMRTGYLLLLSLVVYPFEGDERDSEDDSIPFNPWNIPKKGYKPSSEDMKWLRTLVRSLSDKGEWQAPMGFKVKKKGPDEIELVEARDTEDVKETIRRTLLIAEKIGIKATFKKGRSKKEKMFNGARIPLLDKVQGIVGHEIASRIPGNGWTPDELHKITDNGRFDGVGNFADWACGTTGCISLDSNYETCHYQEGDGAPYFMWSDYNVSILAKQYPKLQDIRGKIDHLVTWLELDPVNNFRDLLDKLLEHPPAETREPVSFERDLTWLEQFDEEDEVDNDNDTNERE